MDVPVTEEVVIGSVVVPKPESPNMDEVTLAVVNTAESVDDVKDNISWLREKMSLVLASMEELSSRMSGLATRMEIAEAVDLPGLIRSQQETIVALLTPPAPQVPETELLTTVTALPESVAEENPVPPTLQNQRRKRRFL